MTPEVRAKFDAWADQQIGKAMTVLPPEWKDPYEIPEHLKPAGMSFQWCAKRADSTDDRGADYEKMLDAGWVLVPPQWIPGGRNMIAGSDLMCRPKWMTERAQMDNEAKAKQQVDDWAASVGAAGFSGGVRTWPGDWRGPTITMVGDSEIAKKIAQAEIKALPQQVTTVLGPKGQVLRSAFGSQRDVEIMSVPQTNNTAACPAIWTEIGAVRLDQVPALIDASLSDKKERYRLERELRRLRRPRYPWRRWLFNLISIEERD
jgi:hypothetical protein